MNIKFYHYLSVEKSIVPPTSSLIHGSSTGIKYIKTSTRKNVQSNSLLFDASGKDNQQITLSQIRNVNACLRALVF